MGWKLGCLIFLMTVMFWGFPIVTNGQGITLDQAVEEALVKNPGLLQAERKLKSARARIWEGISLEYPEVFFEVEGVPEGASWDQYEEKKIGIAQEIAFPLEYAFRGRHQHWEAKIAEADWMGTRNMLVSDVKKGFYRVLLLEEQIELQEDIVRITRETVDQARLRVLAGESSPYDTLKVKVDLAEVENRLAALVAEGTVARKALAGLLYREYGPVDVVGSLTYSPIRVDLDSLKQAAVMHHPRMLAARAASRREGSHRTLAWMGLMPSFHFKYFHLDVPEAEPSDRWGGEIGLSIPLWFFARGQGSIRSAHHRYRAAEFGLAADRREVLLGVERAFSRLSLAEKQVKNFQENTLQEVEELVRIATRSYEEGEMSYLELNEALRTMDAIQAGYAEALYAHVAALVDLEEAVGMLRILQKDSE